MPQTQSVPPITSRLAARMRESAWLHRRLEVMAPERVYEVTWDGRAFAREAVLVDGQEVATAASIWWWVPRFEFLLGPHQASIDVRVSLWLTVSSFRLTVAGEVLHTEGRPLD